MPQYSSYSDLYRQSASKKLGKFLESEGKKLKKCGSVQKSPSSKATAIFARGSYFQYVSTEKWRERRWWLFSTDPGCKEEVTERGKKMAWTALTPSTPETRRRLGKESIYLNRTTIAPIKSPFFQSFFVVLACSL